ncbi:NADP-dependent 3-hydroxy acid dehydrogenase YdfG [Chitinophaga jiangningensis]|uniref:NADP-dependent 3-hydroxy acid dehydrogenase YdfG n=2 Tax=Chitinophaga jiangningensis TaxID=1419482 RepID=A0A1M7INA8_9BACT|nr:NADP-dependent 3-hydroxy acid dehydrogenase YdfG [Chitinophaga jiangningensis]
MHTGTTLQMPQGFTYCDIAGKRVLVTGGTTGIGRSIARMLAQAGAQVLIFGRHEKELNDALQQANEGTGKELVKGFIADAGNAAGIATVFAKVDQELGGLDVLINNVGLPFQGVDKGSYEEWDYVIKTNLLSYMACTHEAMARFKDRAQLIFIGSMSAEVKDKNSSVYTATKAGIRAFVQALRKEVEDKPVKVSLVEPGLVSTDLHEMPEEKRTQMLEEGTIIHGEDIALMVWFILTQPWYVNTMMSQVLPLNQKL